MRRLTLTLTLILNTTTTMYFTHCISSPIKKDFTETRTYIFAKIIEFVSYFNSDLQNLYRYVFVHRAKYAK